MFIKSITTINRKHNFLPVTLSLPVNMCLGRCPLSEMIEQLSDCCPLDLNTLGDGIMIKINQLMFIFP